MLGGGAAHSRGRTQQADARSYLGAPGALCSLLDQEFVVVVRVLEVQSLGSSIGVVLLAKWRIFPERNRVRRMRACAPPSVVVAVHVATADDETIGKPRKDLHRLRNLGLGVRHDVDYDIRAESLEGVSELEKIASITVNVARRIGKGCFCLPAMKNGHVMVLLIEMAYHGRPDKSSCSNGENPHKCFRRMTLSDSP